MGVFNTRKDYTTDKLRSGLLQLSPGTHLVFDETKMSVGQLQDMGKKINLWLSSN